jgi:hypothetical protein
VHRGVQHADQQLDELDADPGETDGQCIATQQEHGAHDIVGQRLADTGGVGADEVALQLGGA